MAVPVFARDAERSGSPPIGKGSGKALPVAGKGIAGRVPDGPVDPGAPGPRNGPGVMGRRVGPALAKQHA